MLGFKPVWTIGARWVDRVDQLCFLSCNHQPCWPTPLRFRWEDHTCALLDNGEEVLAGQWQPVTVEHHTDTNAPPSSAINPNGPHSSFHFCRQYYTRAILDNGDAKCWVVIQTDVGDGGSTNTDTNAPSSTPINLGGRTAVAPRLACTHLRDSRQRSGKVLGSRFRRQLGNGGLSRTITLPHLFCYCEYGIPAPA